MIIRRGKYDDDDERGSSVMKMFECGRTTLVMLRTLPNDFPDQTSTAFAFITAAAFQFGKSVLFDGGIITSLTLIVIVCGKAALLMARTAVLPPAIGFRHRLDGGP
tara:strand:- start:12 stop:329 length:318 start_codon:yes stop_codon:yes gene_type:complete